MLIDASSGTADLAGDAAVHWQSTDRHTIGWKGHLFLPGEASGAATIRRILALLPSTSIDRIYPDLHGIFGLFVQDKQTGVWTILGDHSGLYRIFYDDAAVSTSFLDLARRSRPKLDRRAVVEFLMLGGNFGRQTPLEGITKLRRDEVLTLTPGAEPEIERRAKRFAEFDADRQTAVADYFDRLVRSIEHRRVSVDLTGGFDSRLIACMLDRRGLAFECALAGIRGSNEFVTASRVAERLGREYHFVEHDIATLEADLATVFFAGDGLGDVARFHRDRQLCADRLARGIDLMVHGGGGGFFQDSYFAHDFPRYGSKSANLERYFRLKLTPITLPASHLTPAARALTCQVEENVLAKLNSCREATNNRTYERVGFEYRAPETYGVTFSNYINMGMGVEAPFLDWQMMQTATRMSPWQRLFMMWHRQMITRECPQIAELPTADRFTASSRPQRLVAELGNYTRVQFSRVGRKLGERYLGRSLFKKVGQMSDDLTPGFHSGMRRSALLADAVAALQAHDILAPTLEITEIRDAHLGRIMTMGALLDHLDGAWPMANDGGPAPCLDRKHRQRPGSPLGR